LRGRLPHATTRGLYSGCRSKMLRDAFAIYRMQQDAHHPHKMYSGHKMLREAFAHYKMHSGLKVCSGLKMR
jgi:hypothetical protein